MRANEARQLVNDSVGYEHYYSRLSEAIRIISMNGQDCCIIGDAWYVDKKLTKEAREHITAWLKFNGYDCSDWKCINSNYSLAISWGNSYQALIMKRVWEK